MAGAGDITGVLEGFADLLAPRSCAACGAPVEGAALCGGCLARVPSRVWPVEPPAGCRSAWFLAPYDHPLGAAWRRGKYRPDPWAIDAVARVLVDALPRSRVDVVVPVPQDRLASWRRGLYPVGRLADHVAAALELPRVDALRRGRGPALASLQRSERAQAARGVYRSMGRVEPGDVLLVDDVLTTGATASACAWELLGSGARRVHLLVLCHAFA